MNVLAPLLAGTEYGQDLVLNGPADPRVVSRDHYRGHQQANAKSSNKFSAMHCGCSVLTGASVVVFLRESTSS